MAQATQTNPITNFFNQFRQQNQPNQQQNQPQQRQNPTNGPSSQQGKTGNGSQQNVDPAQFKFDPMTGKPVGAGASNNPETQQDPLSAYKDLWKKSESGNDEQVPQFTIKPETINAAAEGLDFMGSLPEGLNLDGFGENKETLAQLLNHVARMTYATAINHQSQLTGKFTDLRLAHENKNIPKHIRESMTNFSIDNDPAASKSPVIKESLRMVSKQFRDLHPDATPDQIAKMSKAFFSDLAGAMNPEKTKEEQAMEQNQAPGGIDFDWSKYAGLEERQ
jgi:hypothetical protein